MSNDEDDVLGIDLDAWQAPPPPANIADGVIARMRSEVTQVSVQALPVEQAPSRLPRKWWLASGVTVAVATATLVTFALTRGGPPANTRGISAGDRAAHIALGPSSADVDPNTVVSWRREGGRITAQQAGGIAAWRVGDDDNLTIETNLGSIEATNASLRVEVQMLDTKKQIALSAITAAAVSVVTVVVYEGVVRVRAGDTTTTVAPGTAYQIRSKGENVIVEDQANVGAAPVDPNRAELERLQAEIAAKEAERQLLVKQINDLLPENLEKDEVQRVMKGHADEFRICASGWTGKIDVRVTVKPDGTVGAVEMTPPDAKPVECVARIVNATTYSPTKRGVVFKYPIVFNAPPVDYDFSSNPFSKKANCDAEQLLERGQALFSAGQPGEALDLFEQAYACKADKRTLKLMFASACKSKQTNKAQQIWKKLAEPDRNQVVSLCVSNGILIEDLEATSGSGKLNVANKGAPAKVLVDGVEVGTAPIYMDLPAGKHKVTLVVGVDKYTFSVVIKAGETASLVKSIQ